ncbi:hypothetical protein AZH53_09245 [Methanomicrobiaceae archaeon CYW5]|nr:hypothetical protein [Methanovulcanius yangii]
MKVGRLVCSVCCLFLLMLVLATVPAAAATTELTVVRYTSTGAVAQEKTVTYEWMEANLPVQGDGTTHYYHQGPVFEGEWERVHPGETYDYWDPAETVNYRTKDYGAAKGTAVRDLCDLVGGMSDGDTVKIIASDGFYKYFPYDAIYRPPSRMGTAVVTWYRPDYGYVPNYFEGMRLVFFADTSTNPDGWHVFGITDMKETLPEEYWHWYWGSPTDKYPTTTGLSVQYLSRIEIYPGSSGVGPVSGGGGSDDSFTWKPEMGRLNVTSSPSGAAVILDGEETEYLTNASIADLPVGDYGVTVVRDGYASPREVWVTVPADGTAQWHFDLEELYAPLMVRTWPEDAVFFLDGENIGRPAGVALGAVTVANHSVTVTAEGYVPETRHFRVEDGEGAEILIALSPVIAPEIPDRTNETLCSFGPGTVGENVSLPSLSLIDGEGNILTPGASVEAVSPAGRLYICLSNGYNSTRGEGVQPQFEVQSGETVLFPKEYYGCSVTGPAGETVAVTGIYEAPAGRVRVTGTGGCNDTAIVGAVAVLTASEGPRNGWYATFEGVTPASGVIGEITLPSAAYAHEGNVSMEVLLTTKPDSVLPDFSLGDHRLETASVERLPRAVLVRFVPVPVPGTGAVFMADGDGEALMHLLLVSGASGDVEGMEGAFATEETPEPRDDGGWFGAILSWLAGLFGQDSPNSETSPTPVAEVPTSPPQEETPAAAVPTPEETATPADRETGATIPPRGMYVTSVPVGAAISLDGKATGDTTPALFTGLKEGLHRVSVRHSASGRTETSDVWVHDGMLVPVDFTLVGDPIESEVTIRSADGEPVEFTLNGAYPLYETPKDVTLTTPVSWVATQTDGAFISVMVPFSPRNGEIVLPAAGMTSSPCSLRVQSEPEGAAIFVDGYPTGLHTPATVEKLSTGVHTVTIHLDGYLPDSREIQLVDLPRAVDEEVGFTLAPYASGDMCLTSDPAGAKVYLYGRYIGCRTPCTVSGMAIGTYAVGFTLEDTSRVVDVTVIPGGVAEGVCIFHDLVDENGNGQTETNEEIE